MSRSVNEMNALLESLGSHHRIESGATPIGDTLLEVTSLLLARIAALEARVERLELHPHSG